MKKAVVIATIKSWNINLYKSWTPPEGYEKYLITSKEELTGKNLSKIKPRFIFFPHWSWIIPADIYENYDCIVFHMTDLPFGRGGSPLQNLLVRGIYKTKLSAIKVDKGIDSGPVYMKRDFEMSEGSAQEIFEKAARIDFEMMSEIIKTNPAPKRQKGKIVVFGRRGSGDNQIPDGLDVRGLYDFIRMLDAEGYPRAFIQTSGYKIELSKAKLEQGKLKAAVEILVDKE